MYITAQLKLCILSIKIAATLAWKMDHTIICYCSGADVGLSLGEVVVNYHYPVPTSEQDLCDWFECPCVY